MKKREYFMEKKPARAIALLPIGVYLKTPNVTGSEKFLR